MRIDGSIYGSIIIDGMRYDHDVMILGNSVSKRQNASKITAAEVRGLMSSGADVIILGTGHSNMCSVEPAGAVEAQIAGIEIIAKPTAAALEEFNKLSRRKKVAAIFHVV